MPSPSQPADEPSTISCGAGLVINSARREVQVDGTIVDLTRIEYDVLEYLATHLSRVCTREEMVLAIWSSALTHDHHLVDVHVANLRGKLRRHSDATWIHTIRGIGYRMDREGQTAGPPRRRRSLPRGPDRLRGLGPRPGLLTDVRPDRARPRRGVLRSRSPPPRPLPPSIGSGWEAARSPGAGFRPARSVAR